MHSSRMRAALSSSRGGVGGWVCLSAYWDTPPGCGPGHPGSGPGDPPPGCGPGDPLLGMGLETPLDVGLETSSGQTPQLLPWVWACKPARHAGIPPPAARLAGIPTAMHAGIPSPPCGQNS